MVGQEKRATTTTQGTGSGEPVRDTKLERLNQALKFAESSMAEVQSALGDAGSVKELYEQDLGVLREQLSKSDDRNMLLRDRISQQDTNIVNLRSQNDRHNVEIERLEAESATLRRAKANLEKIIRDGEGPSTLGRST